MDRKLAAVSLFALCCFATQAQADLVISSQPTKNASCNSFICRATGKNAVLNAGLLVNLLANSSVTVETGTVTNSIIVSTAISWASGAMMTLDACQSVEIGKTISVMGEGGITIKTADGCNHNGSFQIIKGGRITFMDLGSTFVLNGQRYGLVDTISELAKDISHQNNGFYALGKDCNAIHDSFSASPIPSDFAGSFEGLGNSVSNLTVNDSSGNDSVGFFSTLDPGSSVSDFHLHKVNIAGNTNYTVGGLTGANNGTISNASVEGTITGNAASSVGGIAGQNFGTLSGVGANVTVTDYGSPSAGVGGVTGLNGPNASSGEIDHAAATGSVSGIGSVGGLVGYNGYLISSSWSSASVSAGQGGNSGFAGGFVGKNVGLISLSYATGSANSNDSAGGFAGLNQFPGEIQYSFSTGSGNVAIGGQQLFRTSGGFVGTNGDGGGNIALIADCYSLGSTGLSGSGGSVGGFAGFNGENSQIQEAYETGFVSGDAGQNYVGGFVGQDFSGMSSTYWDTGTSGVTDIHDGAGNIPDDPGITGETTAQLQAGVPLGFSNKYWAENPSINGGLPYLTKNPPP